MCPKYSPQNQIRLTRFKAKGATCEQSAALHITAQGKLCFCPQGPIPHTDMYVHAGHNLTSPRCARPRFEHNFPGASTRGTSQRTFVTFTMSRCMAKRVTGVPHNRGPHGQTVWRQGAFPICHSRLIIQRITGGSPRFTFANHGQGSLGIRPGNSYFTQQRHRVTNRTGI